MGRQLTDSQYEILTAVEQIARHLAAAEADVTDLRELLRSATSAAYREGVPQVLISDRIRRSPGWASQVSNDSTVPDWWLPTAPNAPSPAGRWARWESTVVKAIEIRTTDSTNEGR